MSKFIRCSHTAIQNIEHEKAIHIRSFRVWRYSLCPAISLAFPALYVRLPNGSTNGFNIQKQQQKMNRSDDHDQTNEPKIFSERNDMNLCAGQNVTIITDCRYLLHWLCSHWLDIGFKNCHNEPHIIFILFEMLVLWIIQRAINVSKTRWSKHTCTHSNSYAFRLLHACILHIKKTKVDGSNCREWILNLLLYDTNSILLWCRNFLIFLTQSHHARSFWCLCCACFVY